MAEDYPRSFLELERRFSTESGCRAYLWALRWPRGIDCPRCGHREFWPMSNGRQSCKGCSHQLSVMAGTVFQDSKLPLTTWFRAMWHVASQKNGISALGLQRDLGLGSYKTAWSLLHKLRRAMVRPGRDRLTGVVEVDETYWGAERIR
jgi:transposase-like protein